MKYFIFSLLEETYGELFGPFDTHERALAYKRKHHIFGEIIQKVLDK